MKMRLSINERCELVTRDGTVIGRVSSVTLDLDPTSWGTIGGAVDLGELQKSPDNENPPTPNELQAPEGQLFEAPSSERLVWEHWLKATGTRQKLDSTRRGIVRNALKLRTVEQCCQAIDGLVGDAWWRDNRPHMELRYALRGNHAKGESDEDRIDKMIEKATAAQGADGPTTVQRLLELFPSEVRAMVAEWLRDIEAALHNPEHRGLAATSEARVRALRERGIELSYANGRIVGWEKS